MISFGVSLINGVKVGIEHIDGYDEGLPDVAWMILFDLFVIRFDITKFISEDE